MDLVDGYNIIYHTETELQINDQTLNGQINSFLENEVLKQILESIVINFLQLKSNSKEKGIIKITYFSNSFMFECNLIKLNREHLIILSRNIFNNTGIRVHIREKIHFWFAELVVQRASGSRLIEDRDEVLERLGNCIPSALCHLVTQHHAILDRLKIADDQNNVVAETRGVRAYKEVQETIGVVLHPSLGLNLSQAGCYLVRTEGDGSPHCVAAKVNAEQPACVEIFDGQ